MLTPFASRDGSTTQLLGGPPDRLNADLAGFLPHPPNRRISENSEIGRGRFLLSASLRFCWISPRFGDVLSR
jgi:hypothetical protein